MSSVKESNTSKTAHVMNLLSRSRTAAPIPQTDGTVEAAAPGKVPVAQTPPIIASMQNDIAVAAKIKDALELNLAAELNLDEPLLSEPVVLPPSTSATIADRLTVPEAAEPQIPASDVEPTVVEPSAAAETEPPMLQHLPEESGGLQATGEPVQDPLPQPEATVDPLPDRHLESPPPAGAETPAAVTELSAGKESGLTNIMELLVEEKVEKYIGLFGLCPCARCRDDVTALALNSLPPKYVVMPRDNVAPRLAVYDGRFSATVTAQILRACKEVLENPRHNLP